MNCSGLPDCTCGCCAGISIETPRRINNRPGLPQIAYRSGTWATFRQSMLARLSSGDYPALAALKTRDPDDFSIALVDAAAVMFDILTFYPERLANESYLRTATQRDSLTQLSSLIGYQPSPGVAASTYLAFTIKAATGVPTDPTTSAITIPAGTQVQSVPAQGQMPQSFETSAPILAKADWNALPVQTGAPWQPHGGATHVYLAGIATQLQPGDAILIVGDERAIKSVNSERWDVRLVSTVTPDTARQRTLVAWQEPLGVTGSEPASVNPVFYALRQRAALFGYNAIDPQMLAADTQTALTTAGLLQAGPPLDWNFGVDPATGKKLADEALVDLDAVYGKLTPRGWLVLICPNGDSTRSPAGAVALYKLTSVTSITRAGYGASAKITRTATDTTTDLSNYYAATRQSFALTQSEALAAAEQPLHYPLYGSCVDLAGVRSDLAGVSAIAIVGKSQKLSVNAGVTGLAFVPDDGTDRVPLAAGDLMTLLQPPDFLNADGTAEDWRHASGNFDLYVLDTHGRSGTVTAALGDFILVPSATNDPVAQEFGLVASVAVVTKPYSRTRIVLKSALLNCYDRTATSVNANVAAATAGASVAEMLGSGSAATPNQRFTLKQTPLTYVQAATPSGSVSTLRVLVNGVAWEAEPSLYAQTPTAQVYTAANLPGGGATVMFGDNVEGATLPTGSANVQARYRVGLGSAGNVGANAITTLVDRPLGVGGVSNPMPATGGQDSQSVGDIRANAPLSVLTLGRAVSLADYQNFAATFAGIAKASASWIASGPYRGVCLTVAGAGGAALPPGNLTLAGLVTALGDWGNQNVTVYAQSFYETTFRISADIAYDRRRDATVVEAAVRAALIGAYSFAARSFGEGVSGDEIAMLIQRVPGVVAVNVKEVAVVATSSAGDLGSAAYSVCAYNAWMKGALTTPLPRACAGPNHICPYMLTASIASLPTPAEILVLDPDPKKMVLGAMT